MLDLTEKDGAFILTVRVVPRASVTEIAGAMNDGALKIRIAAPPVDGAANAEIVKFLAKICGLSKSSVEIVSGETAKTKRIKISGSNAESLARAFENSSPAGRASKSGR